MDWVRRHKRDDPAISVVIPSYPASGHEAVCRELEQNQTFDDFEIIVVNDASVDICEARNGGIEKATGDIIALTDDDVQPPAGWLATIRRIFDTDDQLGLIEGSVEGGINYDGKGVYVGCNLAFRREAGLDIGGFDEKYAGWRDDTEFGWRMERDTDWKTAYCADMLMVHEPYPRANLIPRNERMLRTNYPRRYQQRLNNSMRKQLWRLGMRVGLVPCLNRIRNSPN